MTSLEVLILTAFALLIIFVALPYVVGMLYSSLAPLEYRTAAGYILAFADGLEADFGMAGSRKYFSLSRFIYGSFGPVNRSYVVQLLGCGAPRTLRWSSVELWYNSTYFIGEQRLLRGFSTGLTAAPSDTLVAVEAVGNGVRAYPRIFVVAGAGEAYVYVVNATVRVAGTGYLTYEIGAVDRLVFSNCHDARLIVGGSPVSLVERGDVYIVIQRVDVVLR